MNSHPKILGIIPARAGSKGVPAKNMKLLGQMPLIQYTIESALESDLLNTIVVSTDCPKIQHFAKSFEGIDAPFLRPAELARDETPMIEVVSHALEYLKNKSVVFDYVVLLQPTAPFRKRHLIDFAINQIIKSGSDSLVTVMKIPDRYNPHWAFRSNEEDFLSLVIHLENPITRRQDLPEMHYRDGKIYISKTSLIAQGRLLGNALFGMTLSDESDINIDTEEDWKRAETYLANR